MKPAQNSAAIAARRAQVARNERALLSLLNAGFDTSAAAARLGLAPRTAQAYVTRLAHQHGVRGPARLVRKLRSTGELPTPLGAPPPSTPALSSAELHALRLIARERTTEEIARLLGRSTDATYAIVRSAMRKLSARTRAAAVDAAIEHDLLPKRCRSTTIPNILTPHECTILALVNRRWTVYDVADHLGRAPLTIRSHLSDARHKLRARTDARAARLAVAIGALTPDGRRRARILRTAVDAIWSKPASVELTKRETDVLWCLAETRDTRRLARRLRIGAKTVSYYCGCIARELRTGSRVESVQRAIELGLVPSARIGPGERLRLSQRQEAVLRHLARKTPYETIARRLNISYSTVTTYVFTILNAFATTSVEEAVTKYQRAAAT